MPGTLAALVRAQHPGAYDDLDDATLESSVLAKYPQYADLAKDTPAPQQGATAADVGGVALGRATAGVASAASPVIRQGVEQLATSPAVPRVGATAGRIIGGIAPIAGGAYEGGPVGALAGLAASARGSWAGGKTGWFTGKLLQNVAAPVASGLQKIAPYAESLGAVPIYQQLGQYLKAMQDKESQKATPMAPPKPPIMNEPLSAETITRLRARLAGQ